MKNIIIILIIVILNSCKENPNYNPFDDQLDVSVRKLIRDKCDTIPAECGYVNLVENKGKLKAYYQVHMEDFYNVVGKGFGYEIDTFRIKGFRDRYTDENIIDSLINLPIKNKELNEELVQFGYEILSKHSDTIQIVNSEILDTINLELICYPIKGNRYIVRGIGYYKS